jgi:hypothetical protein
MQMGKWANAGLVTIKKAPLDALIYSELNSKV